MLNFVARVFRSWMNVLLWLNLFFWPIGCLIACLITGVGVGAYIPAVIGGTLIGLISNVLFGGFIANFLNMVDDVEKIAKK